MALQKCKECGQEISKKADKCPTCGAPQKPKQYGCGTLIVVVLLGGFLVYLLTGNKTSSTKPSSQSAKSVTAQPAKTQAEKKEDYIAKLKREIDGLDKYKVDTYLESKDSIILGMALFSAWAMIAEEGEQFTLSDEEKALLKRFKMTVSSVQSKAFPRLRDAYGPAVRKALWEHDISAKTFGAGFRTIEFVGGVFAANRNIKEFQTNISDVLHQLRFKQSQYKWYKGADEYTYYDIKSHADTKLIVWVEGGRYREVK